MKIDSTFQDDHQVKLVVEVEPEVFENTKRKAAKKLAKQVKIPGFRPGKAPYNMVQRQVGDAAIVEAAIDQFLEEEYPAIIEETGIDPYGPGSLTDIPNLEPPTFEFLVPLAPEVELSEYRELRIPFEEKEVTEKEINRAIDQQRDQQAVLETVERAAEEGDMVHTLISGERKKAKEDEEKSLFDERRYPTVVNMKGADIDDEWPFPGFSRKLLGMSKDEEATFEHKFAKDFEFEEWQGMTGVFSVKIEEVKSRSLPKVDDEFAKSSGEYETIDEMKADIETRLIESFKQESQSEYEAKIIDSLIEEATIKYPPQMLDHEINHLLEDLTREISYQGMDMDLYLKTREITMDELREEVQPNAETRVKRGLTIMEVGKAEEVSLSAEEVQEKANQTVTMIRQIYPEDMARELTSGDALNNLVNRIMSDEITQRTMTRLRKIAMGLDPDEVDEPEEEEKETVESPEDVVESEEEETTTEEAETAEETEEALEDATSNETEEEVVEPDSTEEPAEDKEESQE